MFVGTGVIGAVCVASIMFLAVLRPLRSYLSGGGLVGVVGLSFGLFTVFENMNEAHIVYHSPLWLLVVAAAFGPSQRSDMHPDESCQ